MPVPKSKGVLVAFEGIDGSGKTTQAAQLQDWAEGIGFEVVSTKEPTAGHWGAKIRNSKFTQRLAPQDELECFVLDRREHVAELINPALERGALVIVDRYYYSTVAYQGARGLTPSEVLELNRSFAPIPDMVFLLDIEPAAGLKRIAKRGIGQDLFETLEELTKAREIFQSLRDDHVVSVDATQTIEDVHAVVVHELVKGPLFNRMQELGSTIRIPEESPDYELLKLAQKLSGDSSIPLPEKIEMLRSYTATKGTDRN